MLGVFYEFGYTLRVCEVFLSILSLHDREIAFSLFTHYPSVDAAPLNLHLLCCLLFMFVLFVVCCFVVLGWFACVALRTYMVFHVFMHLFVFIPPPTILVVVTRVPGKSMILNKHRSQMFGY